MSFITWKDSFSVGVVSIDDQHKKLVEMINQLYQEFYKGITDKFLSELITELEKYTVYHFSYEEKLMKLHNYKDFKEHKAEHEKFIEEIKAYKEKILKDNKTAVIDFATFLKNWLLKHIMGTDKKYKPLLEGKAY